MKQALSRVWTLAFVLAFFSCNRSTPTRDWTPYIGTAIVADDARPALWLPEGALHRLTGPLSISAAPGGDCDATLHVGPEVRVLAPGKGWSKIDVPAGPVDLSSESACGAGVALDLAGLPRDLPGRGQPTLPTGASSSAAGSSAAGATAAGSSAAGSSAAGSSAAGSAHPDIVLISIDTLRPDFLGAYGDPGGLSPHLDALAATATRFARARTQAPWTGPSVAALMTGRQSAGLEFMAEVPSTLPTLAETLSVSGYRTLAAVNNPRLAAETGMARGFDRFRMFTEDEPLVDSLAELLEGRSGPRFLWAHLLGPHLPLDPTSEDLKAAGWDPALGEAFYQEDDAVKPDSPFSEAERRRVRTLYRADLHHADRNLGRLLELIDAKMPNAFVILTSDHGEELWEHGGHSHGHAFWRELLAIPLLVRGPGFVAGKVDGRLVRLCDVGPTLLEAAGASIPPTMECRPLQEPGERWTKAGNPLFGPRRVALEGPEWKIIAGESGGAVALFKVADDPGEAHDLKAQMPDLIKAMEPLVSAFVATAHPPAGPSRVALTVSTSKPAPITVTLRSTAKLETLPGRPPGRWGTIKVEDEGRTWTISARPRKPGPEGVVFDVALAATAPVTAEVRVEGKSVPGSSWRIAGGPVEGEARTIRIDQEGWRSDGQATETPRIDLWMQPRSEAPLNAIFTDEQRERLRAIGYAQ